MSPQISLIKPKLIPSDLGLLKLSQSQTACLTSSLENCLIKSTLTDTLRYA